MSRKILADENVNFTIIAKLKKEGFQVVSVAEQSKGATDAKVLDLAKEHNAFLLTEDSDFGEWVFARKERNVSIIFLRYRPADIEAMASAVTAVLQKHGPSLLNKFAVITPAKMRIRDL